MHIAILVTNTDDSPFADRHPRDGEKFTALIREHRPDWTFESFDVKDGVFPPEIGAFDGIIVTGSPASVRGGASWIQDLFALIRQADASRIPMYGTCFGHQAIALALGGEVGTNPAGWVHGYVEVEPVGDDADQNRFGIYASHLEQVTRPPAAARVIAKGPDCPIGGFAIGEHVRTTQYHPEMTHAFITALVEETASYVGPEVTDKARASLINKADRGELGAQIVRFFESSAGASA